MIPWMEFSWSLEVWEGCDSDDKKFIQIQLYGLIWSIFILSRAQVSNRAVLSFKIEVDETKTVSNILSLPMSEFILLISIFCLTVDQ